MAEIVQAAREAHAYFRPKTLAEAWALKRRNSGAYFIAGGTDLLVKIRDGRRPRQSLISLRGVETLSGVTLDDAGARIGALTTIGEMARHEALVARFPVLGLAAKTLGSVQIRNAATVGGNLCNASPCADTAPPLLVLDARLELSRDGQTREVPLEAFFVAAGETRIHDDEILTAILIDAPPKGARATFSKKSRVRMDLSLVSVAVYLELGEDGRTCLCARVAAGSVAPRPLRLKQTEALLMGRRLDEPTILGQAQHAAAEEITPITDLRTTAAYRRQLTGVLLKRAIEELVAAGAPS